MLGASILGCILVFFAGGIVVMGFITALVSMSISEVGTVPNKAILQITFEKPILEQALSNPLSRFIPYGLYQDDGTGFYDIVSAIDNAAEDSRIDMIYLNTNYLSAGISHIEEIREALKRFRLSGKPVITYADSYSQAGYYLATAADKVFLNPQGEIGLRGFSLSVQYYKGLMDELGIEAQLIRHGKYKSGGEPYTMYTMSAEERDQLENYLLSAWSHWAGEIATSRQISVQTINQFAEEIGCFSISDALSLQLIDQSLYKDQLIEYFCTLQGVKTEKQLHIVKMDTYLAAKPISRSRSKVAILFANGTLYTGTGQQEVMSENYIRTIRQLRADSSVKAVVLRVDSPGGDARAAAIIHRELTLLKEKKPLIVSMGDEAASGGYWISSAGDYLFAAPTTLTGSIGAYSINYNGQKGLNKWLKINVETVKTHKSSDMGSIYRPLTAEEIERIQNSINDTYRNFAETVSMDRERPYEEIDALGQGRIMSGDDALQNGLIDKIGGLTDAVSYAAWLVGIIDYQVATYPVKGTFLERLMQTASSTHGRTINPLDWALEPEKVIQKMAERGVQAKVPFDYLLGY